MGNPYPTLCFEREGQCGSLSRDSFLFNTPRASSCPGGINPQHRQGRHFPAPISAMAAMMPSSSTANNGPYDRDADLIDPDDGATNLPMHLRWCC